MPDLDCRLAKAEEQLSVQQKITADMDKKLDAILENQSRQRGFLAGVVFTVGALASAVTLFFTASPPR